MRWFDNLTVRVLCAIALGIGVGYFFPAWAIELKFLGDIFIKLIKMVIAPIVFFTIVMGIAGMGDMKKISIMGGKALLYFEIITTFALAIGFVVVSLFKPGVGIDISHINTSEAAKYLTQSETSHHSFADFCLNMVPDSVVGAMARGEMLPILLFSVLFGVAMAKLGETQGELMQTLHKFNAVFFKIVSMIMLISPLAAFGAMAYTVGKFGIGSLLALGQLMASVYATMFLFIAVVLGSIAKFYGFSLWRLIRYLKDEILLVLGTSSSESALPSVMEKLEKAGCAKSVVGLVIPTGYSFNLDGTAIYLSMAALFIAQAYQVHLNLMQILTLFGVLILTSKGAAGVTGSGFLTLAATLAALPGHWIPVEGIALVLGVDRFMSEARSITNLIGNSVATVVIAKAEKEFTDTGMI